VDVTHDLRHVDEGAALLPLQYMTKPNVSGFLAAADRRVQDLEDNLYGIWRALLLATAVGDQLDQYGKLLSEPRRGRSDAAYRAVLFTRIAVYNSRGRPQDVIAVARLALGDANLEYLEPDVNQVLFYVQKDGIDPVVVVDTARSIGQAKAVATRGYLVYSTLAPSATLHWGFSGASLSPKQHLWGGQPYTSSILSNWAGAQETKR
jgi:hypothetical protein